MEPQDSALFSALNEELHFLRRIIFANRLHESNCPAFTNHKGDFANLLQGIGEKYCDCWISRNNPETDPDKGYGIYEKATEALQNYMFPSRAAAVDHLTEELGLSRDKDSPNYWQKTFLVIEVKKKETEAPPSRFEVTTKKGYSTDFLPTTTFSSRNEAIAALTAPETPYVENPMAESYYGHHFNIIEKKD